MDGCPITCPCHRTGEGAFLLAACVFTALNAPVFFGADFGAMLTALLRSPHSLPLTLALWAVAAAAGLWLFIIGMRVLLHEGEGAPAVPALAAIAASAFAMGAGWYLPRDWGAWSLASHGFYLSVIAWGGMNLCSALAAQVWMAGYAMAGGDPIPRNASAVDPDQWRKIIERQEREIDSLTSRCERLAADLAHGSAAAPELETVLTFPGVRKAVLKALHPDSQPGASDRERRDATERFQKAAAIFERLGAPQ
jgi:hypothetical protein